MKSFSVWAWVQCEYLIEARDEAHARDVVSGGKASGGDIELNDTGGVRIISVAEIPES